MLIIFKENAIYYTTGIGPDNAGQNGQFADPIFVTTTVGCTNQQSIVLTPKGIMFQSNKGIWLLDRQLQTAYIGAPVERFNSQTVKSATVIPGTNQVRLVMSSGIILMYDYFYDQWGTFTGITAQFGTLDNDQHVLVDVVGRVFKENSSSFKDGSNPVNMKVTTGWINVAGLQGFARLNEIFLVGEYKSPFFLNVSLAYDFNSSPRQTIVVTPSNSSTTWGSDSVWGGSAAWGGESAVFEARLFPVIQKCESFQLSIQERFDSTQGETAGAGLTLSAMNLLVSAKHSTRTSPASRNFG
jgi:hypothetical protein